ncbi:MAG: hypothetical protein HY673_10575 [Chloroflexi bacterium]|nr:hypothetical protein [Chloroflexota bacterium]
MTVGLTSEQLLSALLESFNRRYETLTAQLLAAGPGVNPTLSKVLQDLKQQHPAISAEQFEMAFVLVMSFMDTISRNNESLTRVISRADA